MKDGSVGRGWLVKQLSGFVVGSRTVLSNCSQLAEDGELLARLGFRSCSAVTKRSFQKKKNIVGYLARVCPLLELSRGAPSVERLRSSFQVFLAPPP